MSFSTERIIEDVFKKEDIKVQKSLSKYLNLLFKWHDISNIVSSSDKEYVIRREIYDSYQLNKYLTGNAYSDIGTGGGIPGIIISILNPNKKVILIDRKSTFIDFLILAKEDLGLNNIEVIQKDVLKPQVSLTTDTVLLKNFSNKIISKMNFEKKFTYLMTLIKKSKQVSKVYMLTGSPVLELSKECFKEFNISTYVIPSPFFETNRVVAEVKFENTIYS
tara:strand:- start:1692 stop:2351 length:660 start_codon:yes stop_codon:yes gene_type:complete